jgi:hypothetical protein
VANHHQQSFQHLSNPRRDFGADPQLRKSKILTSIPAAVPTTVSVEHRKVNLPSGYSDSRVKNAGGGSDSAGLTNLFPGYPTHRASAEIPSFSAETRRNRTFPRYAKGFDLLEFSSSRFTETICK